jgi:hypothetical protein
MYTLDKDVNFMENIFDNYLILWLKITISVPFIRDVNMLSPEKAMVYSRFELETFGLDAGVENTVL